MAKTLPRHRPGVICQNKSIYIGPSYIRPKRALIASVLTSPPVSQFEYMPHAAVKQADGAAPCELVIEYPQDETNIQTDRPQTNALPLSATRSDIAWRNDMSLHRWQFDTVLI